MNEFNKSSLYWFDYEVQFHETDAAGVVHFSNFNCYAEFAEKQFLQSKGVSLIEREADGTLRGWVKKSISWEFSSPISFEDRLRIGIGIEALSERSISYFLVIECSGRQVSSGKMTSIYASISPIREIKGLKIGQNIVTRLVN